VARVGRRRSRRDRSRRPRVRGGFATALGVGDHHCDGVRRRRILASDELLGWLDPTIGSETVRWVAEATLMVVLFSDASRIDLAALRREYVLPLRLLAMELTQIG
jgi:hypothetical protein